jgi:S-(hydroxymethyl)glutathione dehydrogenase / alcohol dehydrogenase
MGHESAGRVEAVGDDVSYVRPGDHVVMCPSVFCGECEECLSGRPVLCTSNSVRRTPESGPALTLRGKPVNQFVGLSSFAELMLVNERAVVKVPDEIPLDRAALIGCAVLTGVGAVFNTARVEPGSTVAVVGCGGVGLNCVQGAALAGASRIIAVDRVASKLELARVFGATDTVDAAATDAVAAVRDLTGGGVHYSFEAIGLKPTIEQAFAMLRNGGTTTVIGIIPTGSTVEVTGTDLMYEKRLQGCRLGSNRFRTDMPRLLELYRQGRLKLDELVSARIGLDDVNDAYEKLKSGAVARSVIVFD